MIHPNRARALVAAAVLLAGLSTVAACGDNGTTVSTKDGKVEVQDDKLTVATSEGTTTVGQDLPEGFPKDEVPILDEKVVSGAKGADGGAFAWTVVMQSSRAISDLSAEVKKAFADAGYASSRSTEMGDLAVSQFRNDRYEVGVTAARTGGTVTITYVVKNAG